MASSYSQLVAESRALLHKAKAEAILQRESVSALDAKRRDLEAAIELTEEQRAQTRIARQAARDMAYRVEAANQAAQQRRAKIREKRLEDYKRELCEIRDERRRREADSERWWTTKLLGVLEDQVDASCGDMARVRSEISRTRAMLEREAQETKLNAALNRPNSTHIHHYHHSLPVRSTRRPSSAHRSATKASPSSKRTHVHNHTHIHYNAPRDRGSSASSVLDRSPPAREAHGSALYRSPPSREAHASELYRSPPSRGASASMLDRSPPLADSCAAADSVACDNDDDAVSIGDDVSDAPSSLLESESSSDGEADLASEVNGSFPPDEVCRTGRVARGANSSFTPETPVQARTRPSSASKERSTDEAAATSQLEGNLAGRHGVLQRERKKLARLEQAYERNNRTHCSQLLRAIDDVNAEIKGIRSDQHRVLAKERARSRKLERQLRRLEECYRRVQAAKGRRSWVPSGYGTC